MKKTVWINRSNGQLCVTIPRNCGIKEGDIVSVEKQKISRIVYSPVTADMFHYGHLRLLEEANKLGDFHICGVLTDEAISSYKEKPIASLKERMSIASGLRCVDMVMVQSDKNPTENLEKIHTQFRNAELVLVYGSNWKEVPGRDYIRKIKGRIIQPPFYSKLPTGSISGKIHNL